MHVFHTDSFGLDLPASHPFPQDKYRRLREMLQADPDPVFQGADWTIPPAATDDELHLVHTREYVAAWRSGTLDADRVRRIGFPQSDAVLERSLRSCGATLAASRSAARRERSACAIYLGGGTHHAYPDRGGGYCVFNDCAVAARALQGEGLAERVLIVDLDVHHGDGTAAVFADDPSVFTLSLHGARNYPRIKPPSDLDVPLPDGCTDRPYLDALDEALDRCLAAFAPDHLFYLAGADPHHGDRLGRLALTDAGLAARDRRIFTLARELDVSLTVTLAGGYGRMPDTTLAVHRETVHQALSSASIRPR